MSRSFTQAKDRPSTAPSAGSNAWNRRLPTPDNPRWQPSPNAPVFQPQKVKETSAFGAPTVQVVTNSNAAAPTKVPSQQPQSSKRKPKTQYLTLGDLIPKSSPLKKRGMGGTVNRLSHPLPEPTSSDLYTLSFPALRPSEGGTLAPVKQPVAVQQQLTPLSESKSLSRAPKKEKIRKPDHSAPLQKTSTGKGTATALVEPRSDSGAEHDLLRLMKQGKLSITAKGRQRVRPRKKKFSSLKKKVLAERLRKWKELHPEHEGQESKSYGTTVCLYGFADQQALEDDEEREEVAENLRDMASQYGAVCRIFIPVLINDSNVPCFVDFDDVDSAAAAVACWEGITVAGQTLHCKHCQPCPASDNSDQAWEMWCVASDSTATKNAADELIEVAIDNVLTEDDLAAEDCLEETISDIRGLAQNYGTVVDVRVEREPRPQLVVVYHGDGATAKDFAEKLGQIVLSGSKLSVEELSTKGRREVKMCSIMLYDVLTDDDLEDAESLDESLDDIKELAGQFGLVVSVTVSMSDGQKAIKIDYIGDEDVANKAVRGFHGLQIGGAAARAARLCQNEAKEGTVAIEAWIDNKGPMYSGDKLVPERFAECKRVPKVPNTGNPRHYAVLISDVTAKEILLEMLAELSRLQRRALDEKNTKAKRRIVMGLREVARGMRAHKVKMVVMANNLDEYGVLDEKLQEILNLAIELDIPVLFELSKRALGKAVGKTIKIAVVGIQSAEGAHQQFKKLAKLAPVSSVSAPVLTT